MVPAAIAGIHKLTNNGSGAWSQAYLVYANAILVWLRIGQHHAGHPLRDHWAWGSGQQPYPSCSDNGAGFPAVTTNSDRQEPTKIFRGVAFAPLSVFSNCGQLLLQTPVKSDLHDSFRRRLYWLVQRFALQSGRIRPFPTPAPDGGGNLCCRGDCDGGTYRAATATTTVTTNTPSRLCLLFLGGVASTTGT